MRLRMRWLIQKLEFRNLFSPASCKVASFPMVLDLMHECYVISFTDVFHFLIWRRSCFVVHFHISSQKLQGKGLAYCFLPLEPVKITRNWNFYPKTKHVFSLLVTFDGDIWSNRKKTFLVCAIFRILIHSDPKTLQISFFIAVFGIKLGRQMWLNLQKVSLSHF